MAQLTVCCVSQLHRHRALPLPFFVWVLPLTPGWLPLVFGDDVLCALRIAVDDETEGWVGSRVEVSQMVGREVFAIDRG